LFDSILFSIPIGAELYLLLLAPSVGSGALRGSPFNMVPVWAEMLGLLLAVGSLTLYHFLFNCLAGRREALPDLVFVLFDSLVATRSIS